MTKRNKILLAAGIFAIIFISVASFAIFSFMQSKKAKTPEFKGFIEAVVVAEVPFEQMVSDSERLVRIRIDKIIPSTDERLICTTLSENSIMQSTFYEATITYDYTAMTETDEFTFFIQAGTYEWQMEGDPIYLIGDEIVAFIIKSNNADNVYGPLSGFHSVFDIKKIDDVEYLYKRGCDIPVKEYYLSSYDKAMVTSTPQNRALYVQKTKIEDLLETYNNMRDSK